MNNLYNGEDVGSHDDKHLKHDCKNSRRKMDKPRKRKKEQELGCTENTGKGIHHNTTKTNKVSGILEEPEDLVGLNGHLPVFNSSVTDMTPAADHQHSDSLHSSPPPATTDTTNHPQNATTPLSRHTPVPEDLSVNNPPAPATTSNSPMVMSPAGTHIVPDNQETGALGSGRSDKAWPTAVSSSSPPVSHYPEVSTTAAVVNTTSSSSVRDLEEVMNKHLPMTQGEAELMRTEYAQSLLGLQKHHKSTIQWVGSSVPNNGELTASNLLRSLYANRETVIRSNVYNPRPQYYSDVQSSLLTPPGATTDPYKDSFGVASSKTSPTSTSYTSNLHYMPNSMASSTGMPDGYSMTPPSSVSPQEKYSYGDQLHYGGENSGSGVMPIKPQAYSLPAGAHLPSAYDKASQYSAAAAAAYYGPASYAGHYREHAKNSAMW